eukprot:GHRR01015229.1.p2 GENE.GHRR01015229.1~~GHRR01015229.1.p2  ORF type:complete len:193 (+),score=65.01 GHRR01015229.1:513-1091(+)
MTRETSRMAAATAAAFTFGLGCGAAAGAYLIKKYSASWGIQQNSRFSDASCLPMTPGNISPAPSISCSQPATPRMSSFGGRDSMSRSDSLTSMTSMAGIGDPRLRMVFVVRQDLNWTRQKLAVMTAHAALALFKKVYKSRNPVLAQWELAKGPKLVLRAEGEQQLMAVADAAREQGIPSHSIAEATGAQGTH